jgi:hypothetical protein
MIELEHQSPAAAHWCRQQYESLFASSDPQFSRRLILLVETSSEMQSEKASSEPGRILAFLVAHGIDQEWELENIVVAEESRRECSLRFANRITSLAPCIGRWDFEKPGRALITTLILQKTQ